MPYRFESSVNPQGIQTIEYKNGNNPMFESSVNPQGIQTSEELEQMGIGLRVV